MPLFMHGLGPHLQDIQTQSHLQMVGGSLKIIGVL